ncbi:MULTISPECIES: GntP family permease [Geobacillus]|jgi:H+/gluconate symporter-like permease|uniref:GntP family permease n=1 Tax=Geobacillus thermodenitrificans TaxID=33940 RepID=A0ABY9Q8B9_GEOTD|nr:MULTISPECIES: SLC13 family permease [Geobacillus]ATO35763.1 citrate transporter [Geobacillus thermodenitrificans]KQB93144.1 citrate transporter [Geobacillus sp. PA-3]MED0661989.1 GntP family permease [Geobacillus thermodenitrificans]NNU88873.1 GntP family permease [Geobacillus sp. MR]PTR46577.1 GntP family permease [Geobacillus thermodenitrificans]
MLGMIGLLASLGLLIFLTMRGINIIIAALISSILVALTGGLNLEKALMESYMTGFTGYFASWFLIFLAGAIFGKVMEDTGSADSIAHWVKEKFGAKHAVLAVVAACAIMTYGGVSLFVVGFSVYPIAVSLFRQSNTPHRFIPAAMVFGSVSFTMTSPYSPEIQNIIPTQFFHTTPGAGGWVGLFVGATIAVTGSLYLTRVVQKAKQNGETFSLPYRTDDISGEVSEVAASIEQGAGRPLPNIVCAMLPLVVVIVSLNILAKFISSTSAGVASLILGIVLCWVLNAKFVRKFWESMASGTQDALVAAANTCAVVGFGEVAKNVPAFQKAVDVLVNIPGPELLGLGLAVTIICGMTGSASGGLGIALPILAPIYMAKGLDPGAMHRVAALASGGLDSLPHNGYIVTTIRAVCHETHERTYKPIFVLSVVIPLAGMFLAILLYSIF